MAYLAGIRVDKKCGSSGVADGKKCSKPQGHVMGAVKTGAKIGAGLGGTVGAVRGGLIGGALSMARGTNPVDFGGSIAAGSGLGAVGGAVGYGLLGAGIGGVVGLATRKKKKRRDSEDERADKKCGNSGVAEGKQCRKGAGSPTKGSSFKQGTIGERALMGGGLLTAAGGIANGLNQARKGNIRNLHNSFAAAHGGLALAATGLAAQGRRQGNKRKQRTGERALAVNAAIAGANVAVGRREINAENLKMPRINVNWTRKSKPASEAVQKVTVREIPNERKMLPPARSKKRKDSIDLSSGLTASLFR